MCNPTSVTSATANVKQIIQKFVWVILGMALCFTVMTSDAKASAETNTDKILIAITQIVDHPALDQARKGVIAALAKHGYVEHRNIEISYQSAQGSTATASQIIQKFMAQSPRLIVALSTPSAQVALKAVKNAHIPVIFSSVTDPYAAGLLNVNETSSEYITGSIDTPPLDDIVTMMQNFMPKLAKVGVIYSSSEINSVKVVADLKTILTARSIHLEEAIANNSGQVGSALSYLADKVDAIFVPADNVIFSALDSFVRTNETTALPLFTSDPDAVRKGLLGCIGYNQEDVGYAAGELAAQVLKGVHLKDLPVRKPSRKLIVINENTMKVLKLSLPVAYKDTAQLVK